MHPTRALPWVAAAFLIGGCSGEATKAPEQALLARYGCMTCHGMVHRQVGPGFAQIAARYRADAEAPERLAGKIRSGAVGQWGRTLMPAQPQVTESDAGSLARWILGRPSSAERAD